MHWPGKISQLRSKESAVDYINHCSNRETASKKYLIEKGGPIALFPVLFLGKQSEWVLNVSGFGN